jgi:hypothetical protein
MRQVQMLYRAAVAAEGGFRWCRVAAHVALSIPGWASARRAHLLSDINENYS